jgi:2OG-Fe(II) oxygenase superfamily
VKMRERFLRADLDVSNIRGRIERRGIVEISDVLAPAWANRIHRYLSSDMPRDSWSLAIRAGGDPEYFADTPESQDRIRDAYSRARTELREGRFGYCFRRTLDDHLADCHCCECEFRNELSGPEMLDFVAGLGLGVMGPGEMFASKYSPGSFLSPHHDEGNGRAAFVVNLSHSWLPQWGGLLTFLKDDWRTVRRVCTPAFNTLCLFRLPGDRQVPHLVTQVVAHHRLAFTGWYVAEGGDRR